VDETQRGHGEKINQDSYLTRSNWAWEYGIGAAKQQNKTVTVHAFKKLLNISGSKVSGPNRSCSTSHGANRWVTQVV